MSRSEEYFASPIDYLREIFDHPPREFSPTPIWWWSGERVELERLRWQMDRMAEGGIYNVVILNLAPSGPLYGKDADDPPFMSEDWWSLFLGICEHAKKLGVRIWFYDQVGFSGANFQGQLCLRDSRCRGMLLVSKVTDEGEAEFPSQSEPLSAFATELDEEGQPVEVPRKLPITRHAVRCEMPGRYRLRLVYALQGGFDYFSRQSCKMLLDRIHGEFERRAGDYFGEVIVGSFQDELPSMPTWGGGFSDAFLERAGYELEPLLWTLWEGETDTAKQVRSDYQRVRAELAEEAFFRPFFDWHRRHGMICGFDQQGQSRGGDPIDNVRQYADYLRTHRWYGAPGSDHHGEARIHSSLAQHYGCPRVWIESFHSSGWGGTLEETFDWLLPWWLAGGNLYNPHAVYYSTHGGWWEWAPPSTCWRQPYWKHYRVFAAAVSRICALLALGEHCCEVAVLHPTTTVQAFLTLDGPLPAAEAARKTYHALLGQMAWYEPKVGALDEGSVDFSVLDDETLQRSAVLDGRLVIGRTSYSTVLLPACVILEEATARQLAKFVESGGRLIAVETAPAAKELQGHFAAHPAISLEELREALHGTPKVISGPMPMRHMRAGEVNLAFIPLAHPCATEMRPPDKSNWWFWFQMNYTFDPKRYQRPLSITIHESPVAVEAWDPVTGQRFKPDTEIIPGGTRVSLPDDASPGMFLIWGAGEESVLASAPAWRMEQELSTRWSSRLEPTLENRFGDMSWPAYPGAPPVQTWDFKHREENGGTSTWPEGTYSVVRATFGPQGWRRGPVPANAVPSAGQDWQPAIYSLSRGIWKDPLHYHTLGLSGHVPEEFLDFGPMKKGESAQFKTSVWREAASQVYLAVGAPGRKSGRVNGESLTEAGDGYLWMQPMELNAGWNLIEWEFSSDADGGGRCYWALVTNPDQFRRPEVMSTFDTPHPESVLVFGKEFELPFDVQEGEMLIHASNPCRTILDDGELGRQGGFMPYGHQNTSIVWQLGPLRSGRHRIELHTVDESEPVRLLVDAQWRGTNGQAWELISSADWMVSRDGGAPQPVALRTDSTGLEPASFMRRRRPHPLPLAHWLETIPADGTVLEAQADPLTGKHRVEWLQWMLPPGAFAMTLLVTGTCALWVDGDPVNTDGESIELPFPSHNRRIATLRVETDRGSSGGGLFLGPVTYKVGEGEIELGDWSQQGLESYSGGIRYHAEFLVNAADGRRRMLDIGRVRGTAEVWINGQNAGSRILSPYRFDITEHVGQGKNKVEILVFNTLAPYLSGHSPAQVLDSEQKVSGLFGPVRILELLKQS